MNFKRLLKPILVILAILLLTLSVSAGDLYSTYDKRIKITIDHTKIDADLSWFPVTVFLTSSQMEEVFTEFDADEDFDRIAFTSSDGETQLYADCELFDISESKAIYHVSKTGWTVSSSTDTDIYLYYDNTADHNTTYISKSGGTAAQSVWDSSFKAVYHMADNTTSTIVDSTSNNNDGTKKASGEPIEATGKVGQGQDFDGSDDYIALGGAIVSTHPFTIEAIARIRRESGTYPRAIISVGDKDVYNKYYHIGVSGDKFALSVRNTSTITNLSVNTYNDSNFHYVVGTFVDNTEKNLYVDIADKKTITNSVAVPPIDATEAGRICNSSPSNYYNDVVDEIRISNSERSDAWIGATYSTLWDTLLTYGSEETGGSEPESSSNVLFIFSNF